MEDERSHPGTVPAGALTAGRRAAGPWRCARSRDTEEGQEGLRGGGGPSLGSTGPAGPAQPVAALAGPLDPGARGAGRWVRGAGRWVRRGAGTPAKAPPARRPPRGADRRREDQALPRGARSRAAAPPRDEALMPEARGSAPCWAQGRPRRSALLPAPPAAARTSLLSGSGAR